MVQQPRFVVQRPRFGVNQDSWSNHDLWSVAQIMDFQAIISQLSLTIAPHNTYIWSVFKYLLRFDHIVPRLKKLVFMTKNRKITKASVNAAWELSRKHFNDGLALFGSEIRLFWSNKFIFRQKPVISDFPHQNHHISALEKAKHFNGSSLRSSGSGLLCGYNNLFILWFFQ